MITMPVISPSGVRSGAACARTNTRDPSIRWLANVPSQGQPRSTFSAMCWTVRGVALLDPERQQRAADQVLGVVGKAEQRDREGVGVQQGAVPVDDHDAGRHLLEHVARR